MQHRGHRVEGQWDFGLSELRLHQVCLFMLQILFLLYFSMHARSSRVTCDCSGNKR